MKDSNFDSIKEKFDNSGVNAPDTINEEAVTAMLPQQPLQEVPPQKSKRKLALGITAAAACAVLTAGAVTFTGLFHSIPQPQPAAKPFATGAALRPFGSRREVQEELKKVLSLNESLHRNGGYDIGYNKYAAEYYADGALSGSSGSASSSAHNSTYTQALGVDEADNVKTTEHYIFYSYGQKTITVFSADGEQAKQVAEVTVFGDEGTMDHFYVTDNRLVVLGSVWNNGGDVQKPYTATDRMTVAQVYDISDITAIRKLDAFAQSGAYVDSRMIGDTLYLISDQYVVDESDWPKTGSAPDSATPDSATPDSATMDEVPVSNMYTVASPVQNDFLVVSRVDIQSGAKVTNTKAILGTADTVYCNQDNLYITAPAYSNQVYDLLLRAADNSAAQTYDYETQQLLDKAEWKGAEQTQIFKFNLEKDIDFTAEGKVSGTVNNQYSLDEYNGYLRVATTSYDINSTLNGDTNNLFVLDGNLKQVGAVTDFAYGESIKAVRYINETAYVITYEQTDPLFVIDVSEPAKPVMMGEVKISGFSTLLVPVNSNTLLGIGYHTEENPDDDINMEIQKGLKIVTFDVTDKANPKVLDTKIYENYDSEVQYNPHALLVNFERGDYTIPMHHYDYRSGDNAPEAYGLLNFRVDNGKINIIDEYTSEKFSTGFVCNNRCVYVGSNQYMVGSAWSYRGGISESFTSIIDCVPYQ